MLTIDSKIVLICRFTAAMRESVRMRRDARVGLGARIVVYATAHRNEMLDDR